MKVSINNKFLSHFIAQRHPALQLALKCCDKRRFTVLRKYHHSHKFKILQVIFIQKMLFSLSIMKLCDKNISIDISFLLISIILLFSTKTIPRNFYILLFFFLFLIRTSLNANGFNFFEILPMENFKLNYFFVSFLIFFLFINLLKFFSTSKI